MDTLAKDGVQSVKRRVMGPYLALQTLPFALQTAAFHLSLSRHCHCHCLKASQSQGPQSPRAHIYPYGRGRRAQWMEQTSHPHSLQMGMPNRGRTSRRLPRLLKSLRLLSGGPDEAEEARPQSPPHPDAEEVTWYLTHLRTRDEIVRHQRRANLINVNHRPSSLHSLHARRGLRHELPRVL